MITTFIAMIIKSAFALSKTWLSIAFGTAKSFFVSVDHWLTPSLLPDATPMENLHFRAWRLDDNKFDLMADIAGTVNIPYEKIQGFRLQQGRWYIELADIGWLRTSDLLQMSIELYPAQLEKAK